MRIQDTQQVDRSEHTTILRIGTIASISADGKRLDATVPGGTLPDVLMTTAVGTPAVGASVVLLLDGDKALAIGVLK